MRGLLLALMLMAGPAFGQVGGQQYGPGPCPVGASSCVVTATGGTTPQALSDIAAGVITLKSFGAVCDGTTDDSAAVTAAIAAGKAIRLPPGVTCNAPSIVFTAIPGSWVGTGQIKTSDGNKRGPVLSEVTSVPAQGTHSAPGTFWSAGTWNGVAIAHEHMVIGATTLTQPSSGYVLIPEAAGEAHTIYNTSGWNQSLSGNSGRTGLAFDYVKLFQYGQGDVTAHWCDGVIGSTLGGATSYLASPAIECVGGQLNGGANGQYIEFLGDLDIVDGGFDIAAAGIVNVFNRTNATEALGTNWVGSIQNSSVGTKPMDSFDRRVGGTTVVEDFSGTTLTYYRMASYTLTGAGTGYTVGDPVTVSGGTALTATAFTVATISGGLGTGPVTGLTVVNTGIYTTAPSSLAAYGSVTVTGGTGTGLTISGQYVGNLAMLLPTAGGCIMPSGTGSPITQLTNIYGQLCLTQTGMSFGGIGSNALPAAVASNVVMLGGSVSNQNTSLGTDNIILGGGVYDLAQKNRLFYGSGSIGGVGNVQTSVSVLRNTITTTTRLTSTGTAASVTNSILMSRGLENLSIKASAVDTTNGDTATWNIKNGTLTLPSTGGTVTYAGDCTAATAPDRSTGAGNTATLQITADNTLKNLSVVVVPPGGTGHTWVGQATVYSDHTGF